MRVAIAAAAGAAVGLFVGYLLGTDEAMGNFTTGEMIAELTWRGAVTTSLEPFTTPELIGELNWRGVIVD